MAGLTLRWITLMMVGFQLQLIKFSLDLKAFVAFSLVSGVVMKFFLTLV